MIVSWDVMVTYLQCRMSDLWLMMNDRPSSLQIRAGFFSNFWVNSEIGTSAMQGGIPLQSVGTCGIAIDKTV